MFCGDRNNQPTCGSPPRLETCRNMNVEGIGGGEDMWLCACAFFPHRQCFTIWTRLASNPQHPPALAYLVLGLPLDSPFLTYIMKGLTQMLLHKVICKAFSRGVQGFEHAIMRKGSLTGQDRKWGEAAVLVPRWLSHCYVILIWFTFRA